MKFVCSICGYVYEGKLHRLNVRSVMQALTSLLPSPAKRHGLPNTLLVLHRVSAKTS